MGSDCCPGCEAKALVGTPNDRRQVPRPRRVVLAKEKTKCKTTSRAAMSQLSRESQPIAVPIAKASTCVADDTRKGAIAVLRLKRPTMLQRNPDSETGNTFDLLIMKRRSELQIQRFPWQQPQHLLWVGAPDWGEAGADPDPNHRVGRLPE